MKEGKERKQIKSKRANDAFIQHLKGEVISSAKCTFDSRIKTNLQISKSRLNYI